MAVGVSAIICSDEVRLYNPPITLGKPSVGSTEASWAVLSQAIHFSCPCHLSHSKLILR